MREALNKLAYQIGWNDHLFTEAELLTLCDCEGIAVVEAVLPECGVYLRLRHRPVIGLDYRLCGSDRALVLAHELGHHLLHTPGMWAAWRANEDKLQWQANVFASCALIPLPVFRRLSFAQIREGFNYSPDLIRLRIQVWQRLQL